MTLLTLVLLAAAPVAEKPKLAVLDLVPGAGVEANVTGPVTEAVVSELTSRGYFQVISQNDIRTMLGVERQKQLMGCNETGCIAELSDALGARFVLSGTLARLGDLYQLTLNTLDTRKAQPLGRSVRLGRDLSTIREQLAAAVAEATATPLPPPPSRAGQISVIAAGGALSVFGLVWGVNAFSQEAQVTGELKTMGALPQTRLEYQERANAAATNKLIAALALGVGLAAIGVGLFIGPTSSSGGASAALVPTPNGVALVGWLP